MAAATFEDLLKVPDHLVAEIVEGELYTTPRPAGPHGRVISGIDRRIGWSFDEGVEGPDGWWIVMEPEIHLGRDIFVPDVAGWRRDRVPEYLRGAAWEVAPDWVCEVLSPSTARLDHTRKMPMYARHGIEWAWLIDPALHTLEIRRRQNETWSLVSSFEGDDVIRPRPFDSIDFPLGSLWLTPPSA